MSARIVLADDSITIQKVIGLTFASEDYALQSFDNGTEALESIKANRPNLVIADTDMPGLNGFELCAEVKRIDRRIPVILLHTTYDAFDTARAQSVGADHASPKPFDSAELLGHIRRLLQSATSGSASEEFAEVEPIEEIEELGEIAPIDDQPEIQSAPLSKPSFAAIEDDSGLLSSDAFGELGDGDLVTADALESQSESSLESEPAAAELPDEIAEELPHDLEELDQASEPTVPVAAVMPSQTPAHTPGHVLWNLAGFEPYATSAIASVAVAAPAPDAADAADFESRSSTSEPNLVEDHPDELAYDEPIEALEAEAAAFDAEPLSDTFAEPANPAASLDTSNDGTAATTPSDDIFDDIPAQEPSFEAPVEESSFTSIADSMYDMSGMDSAIKPAAEPAAQIPQPIVAETGAMMDDFEAFAAAADEPTVGSALASEDTTADPFTEFAAYADDKLQAAEAAAPSGSDPFEQFAASASAEPEITESSPGNSSTTNESAPPVISAAYGSAMPPVNVPSEEQIRAMVANQVRHLVDTEMADQIRTVVSQAVEKALEDILAKLRDRLRLS